jgi:hypothetical protein
MEVQEALSLVRRLYSREGYFSRFLELCAENPQSTYKAVYHLIEGEYFSLFGTFRYIDYNSFRHAKHAYFKSLK